MINGYPFDSELFSADAGLPLVRIRDIANSDTEVRYAGDIVPEALLKGGEILVGMDGEFNVARWRGGEALLNQRVCCVRPAPTIDARFLYYVLPAPLSLINEFTYSTTVKHLSSFEVLKIHIPFPPLLQQLAIADYLDRETARLDALVLAKERVLGLLTEKRQALITRAVTRGLDPKAPLRDSGISWLGEIPSHWRTLPMKRLVVRVESGVSVNAANQAATTGELGVLKTSAVSGGDFFPFENKCVLDAEVDRVACPVRADSVIVSRMNTPILVGESGYVDQDYPTLFLPDRLWQIGFDTTTVVTRFMAVVMSSSGVRGLFSEMATGTSGSMKNLAQEDALGVKVPVPPLDEQRQIAAKVASVLDSLAHLSLTTQRSVELLKERRVALIAAAVTGQIEVGAAP